MITADMPEETREETQEGELIAGERSEATQIALPGEAIAQPAKLLRIAGMLQRMQVAVGSITLDEAGRKQLAEIQVRALDALSEVLSEELSTELRGIFATVDRETPSESEVRIAQAQLVGWLEGLFQGIQASIAAQQADALAQLEHLRQTRRGEEASSAPFGTYL